MMMQAVMGVNKSGSYECRLLTQIGKLQSKINKLFVEPAVIIG